MGDAQQSWVQIVPHKLRARDHLLAPYMDNEAHTRLPRVHHVEKRTSLDQENEKITEIDNIVVLSQKIATGELIAEQVVKAYIRR